MKALVFAAAFAAALPAAALADADGATTAHLLRQQQGQLQEGRSATAAPAPPALPTARPAEPATSSEPSLLDPAPAASWKIPRLGAE
jgi:hypothetical protein